MILSKYILFLLILISHTIPCISQNTRYGSTGYNLETAGSAATGKYAPFWIVSNKYGTVPLDADNAYLRAGVFHQQSSGNGLHWSAGIDVLAATPRYRNVYIQQLYAEVKYKCLNLTIGGKENYTSLWDKELSSGDMLFSTNSRPVPEINISVPGFTTIPFTKGRMQFRGDFAVGRSFDRDYLQQFRNGRQEYIENVLWHHKSLHIRLLEPENKFPFTAIIGIRHHAQWGGTSTNPEFGKQPQSFRDFIRILAGQSGGDDSSLSAQKNVLGNHYGGYDLKFGYLHSAFDIHIYKQHYFDDTSGMELYNFPDGLYGIQADIPNFLRINKIVMEFLYTRNQSGPVHYIIYDHSIYPGYGGGMDNYYNNGEYTTGVSYFNRSAGSPLLTSPEYNDNGDLGFRNNRIRALHIGLQGYLSKQVSYRILATSSESWGTMGKPFLKKVNNVLCAAKISYCHPRLDGWFFSGEVAADFGHIYGDNTGINISVKKSGILKRWY
jgi:hypothetical protein